MPQKYKVFLNERFVLLTNKWSVKDSISIDYICISSKDRLSIQSAFDVFVRNKKIEKLIIIHSDVELIFTVFKSLFQEVKAAGGLVFNNKGEVLMIHRKGFWDLPKGKLEKKERIKDCAVREVEEECGINNIVLQHKLCITYHIYSIKKIPTIKPSHWFVMTIAGRPNLTPQLEEDIDKAIWVSLKKAEKLLDEAYPSIKEVFKAYYKRKELSQ